MLMIGELEQRERFAYALQRALRERKLSERQLAKALEIDPRKVAAWRSKKRLPDIFEVQALAAELRVSEELFRNPPPVPPLPPEPYYPIEQYLVEAVAQGAVQGLVSPNPTPEAEPEPGAQPQSRRLSGQR